VKNMKARCIEALFMRFHSEGRRVRMDFARIGMFQQSVGPETGSQ